jgi:hypothetical protein
MNPGFLVTPRLLVIAAQRWEQNRRTPFVENWNTTPQVKQDAENLPEVRALRASTKARHAFEQNFRLLRRNSGVNDSPHSAQVRSSWLGVECFFCVTDIRAIPSVQGTCAALALTCSRRHCNALALSVAPSSGIEPKRWSPELHMLPLHQLGLRFVQLRALRIIGPDTPSPRAIRALQGVASCRSREFRNPDHRYVTPALCL